MAGITGPTRTGTAWKRAKAKFIAKGKSVNTAARMAGSTTTHLVKKRKKKGGK